MLKSNNQSTLVKIFLITNILVGGAVGSYFSWELSVYCGNNFLLIALAGFLFAVINFFVLVQNNMLSKFVVFLLAILTLGIFVLPLALIPQVTDSELCGYQFCMGQGIDNQSFISQFKSESTQYNSNFCQNVSTDTISGILAIFYTLQYRKNISSNEIWSISEGLPITAIAALSLFSLLDTFLFVIYLCKNRNSNGDRLLS